MINQHSELIRKIEIAIITPCGVLMQMKRTDNNQFRMWGCVLEGDETPIQGAINVLQEEAGLAVDANDLTIVNIYNSFFEGKDDLISKTEIYRFILEFDYLPTLNINPEYTGWIVFSKTEVTESVVECQREFIKTLVEKSFPQQQVFIKKNIINEDILQQLKNRPR